MLEFVSRKDYRKSVQRQSLRMRSETNGFCRVEMIVMNIECSLQAYSYPTEACSTEGDCNAMIWVERKTYNLLYSGPTMRRKLVVCCATFTTSLLCSVGPVSKALGHHDKPPRSGLTIQARRKKENTDGCNETRKSIAVCRLWQDGC